MGTRTKTTWTKENHPRDHPRRKGPHRIKYFAREEVSRKIKAIRLKKKLSQWEVSRRVGIHPANYSQYERGAGMTVDRFFQILVALKATLKEFQEA